MLLAQATTLLQTGQPDAALPVAQRALALLQPASITPTSVSLPALTLLGEIYLELGDPGSATSTFLTAASLDPDGLIPESEGGGSEKFLWLAQLCEEGGEESIWWFEKGVKVLERDIRELEGATQDGIRESERVAVLEEKKRKLAAALCGMVEVWMTDLSYVPKWLRVSIPLALKQTCNTLHIDSPPLPKPPALPSSSAPFPPPPIHLPSKPMLRY